MPMPSVETSEDIFKRKAFTWTKHEAPKLPERVKEPELPSVCQCGQEFGPTTTFCARCGAYRVPPAPAPEAASPVPPPPSAEPQAVREAASEEGGSLWCYRPPTTRPVAVRKSPGADGVKTSELLRPGDVFRVSEEQKAADGVLYLRLADGRGWVMEGMPNVGALCVRQEGPAPGDGKAAAAAPAAAAGASAAPGGGLKAGIWVRTVGLLSRPEMNGKSGVLKGFDAGKGRWKVTLEDGSGTKLLREENLEPLDPGSGAAAGGAAGQQAANEPEQSAAKAEGAKKPEAPKATVCTCGNHLVPHATFCGRCGTLRDALPGPGLPEGAAGAGGAGKEAETPEQFNRRIEEMLTSGDLEWEDW